MGWEDYEDARRKDEKDGMSTRTIHGAMNGMEDYEDARRKDEKDGRPTRTMHEGMNGMGRLRGRRMGG